MDITLKQRIYDLKNTRQTHIDTAKALVLEGKLEDEAYKTAKAEIDRLTLQIKALEELEAQEGAGSQGGGEDPTNKAMKGLAGLAGTPEVAKTMKFMVAGHIVELPEPTVKAFAEAARAGFVVKDLNEGTNEEGGYTVPEDIVTQVERLREAKASLRQLVSVETVSTNKGRRTFKKRSQQVGFAKVAEGGKIAKKDSPQFSILTYTISKYAGFLPVTNELLEDSDENIVQILLEWIADESRVTDNKLILEAINKKAAADLTGLDGIKKAVLVDLDSAFRATTRIVTNSNGVYWLSTLKDGDGRYLLTPIPSDPGRMQLACGAVVIPVVEFPNADLPNTDGTKVPFIVGDLTEGVRLFDRKQLTISSSDVAMAGDFNAFEQDMTLTRAVERLDVQQRDDAAYINGYIDTSAAVAAG